MLGSEWLKEGIHVGTTYCRANRLKGVTPHKIMESKSSEVGTHGGAEDGSNDGRLVLYRVNE